MNASQPNTFLDALPPRLDAIARRRTVRAGEVLFRQGDAPRVILFVLSGEVRLVRNGPSGEEIILQRGTGGFFAEASLWAASYHCDGVVAQSGELLEVPRQAFEETLAADCAFQRAWMQHLTREVRRLRAQCERLGLHGAADRIIHYIESEGEGGSVTLAQSRKSWARELGLSHEALYRSLRRLQDEGVLRAEGQRLTLQGRIKRPSAS